MDRWLVVEPPSNGRLGTGNVPLHHPGAADGGGGSGETGRRTHTPARSSDAVRRSAVRPGRFAWRSRRTAIGGLLVALAIVAGPTHGRPAVQKTAELTLVASKTEANGGFNFNGYGKGALTITVPVGWKLLIHYRNDGNLRHSLDVAPFAGTQPDKAPDPAFPGASTKDAVDGIGPGQEETVSFVAATAGKYEFLCGALGHAQAGMWDYLIISPTAQSATVQPPTGATISVK